MKNEIWKDVAGYEGLYQVSNFGRVKSLNYNHKKETRIMKDASNLLGYHFVNLCKAGTKKIAYIHRLVALAFIPNPYNLPIINHKDCNPGNNTASNLEWCTYLYNNNYDKHRERISLAKYKPVLQYDREGNFVQEYPSAKSLNELYGYNANNISAVCRGKRQTAHNYVWRYKEC